MAKVGGCIKRCKQPKCREQERKHGFEFEKADGSRVEKTKTCRNPYLLCPLVSRQSHWFPAASSLAR